MAGEGDADLLGYMSMDKDDPASARDAWAEFYRRHAEFLYAVCFRAYGALLGGEAGVCDLVAETFKRVYEHAARFDAAGLIEAEALRRRTRAWLGRVAQRLVQDALRGRRRLPAKELSAEAWQNVPPPPRAPGDPEKIRAVRAAIDTLSPKEQMVLRATMQWYQPDRDNQRLPNDVAAELAATLATTPENLRQIRRRAMRKIKACLHGRPPGAKAGEGDNE